MPCVVPWKFSAGWANATRVCRLRSASSFALVSIWATGVVAVFILAAAAIAILPHRAPAPITPQPVAAVASASLPLPDKPSIAVLPFTSIGGDAKQERLADGITDDVITDLSRYRDL